MKNDIEITGFLFGKKIKLELYLIPHTIPNESEIQIKINPYKNQNNIYLYIHTYMYMYKHLSNFINIVHM